MQPELAKLNRFQRVVHARLKALQLEADAATTVKHSGTTGTLREGLLRRFLEDMTLGGISLTGGALLRLENDDVSPQIDIIAALNSAVPRLIFEEAISIVPAEAALLAIEVKSKLKQKHLDQVGSQNKWIQGTKLVFPPPEPSHQTKQIIPTAIFAYDSALKCKTVKEWMESGDGRNTIMCCVVGRFYLQQINAIKCVPADDQFRETMEFISDYWLALEVNSKWREQAAGRRLACPTNPYPHPLEAYLKGMSPPKEA